MKNFFYKLFSDNNNINEKSIVGFFSFLVMIIIALVNVVTAYRGMDFQIHEYIYQSFVIITLGSLGIGSVDKYITRNSTNSRLKNTTKNTINKSKELG
jgi:hypothetical protein